MAKSLMLGCRLSNLGKYDNSLDRWTLFFRNNASIDYTPNNTAVQEALRNLKDNYNLEIWHFVPLEMTTSWGDVFGTSAIGTVLRGDQLSFEYVAVVATQLISTLPQSVSQKLEIFHPIAAPSVEFDITGNETADDTIRGEKFPEAFKAIEAYSGHRSLPEVVRNLGGAEAIPVRDLRHVAQRASALGVFALSLQNGKNEKKSLKKAGKIRQKIYDKFDSTVHQRGR